MVLTADKEKKRNKFSFQVIYDKYRFDKDILQNGLNKN